jgi:hypothetical protein
MEAYILTWTDLWHLNRSSISLLSHLPVVVVPFGRTERNTTKCKTMHGGISLAKGTNFWKHQNLIESTVFHSDLQPRNRAHKPTKLEPGMVINIPKIIS